jgi:glycosyltransferase involved in cell wall biosynthesis
MISFIIPAHNEEKLLGAAIGAIRQSAESLGESHEIVVANDASTDKTGEIALANGAKTVEVNHRKISAVRNSGARAASGDIFVFVDADTLLNPDVLSKALRSLREGAIGGGALIRFEERIPAYARFVTLGFNLLARAGKLAFGCFLFCRREAFEAAGGFDERLYGAEEWALSRALGKNGKFVILPLAVTTSGRKLRTHSGWELARTLGRLAMGGSKALRKREGMGLWYDERRDREIS